MSDEQKDQEYEIPSKSLILAKATPIALAIVGVTLGIIFIILTIL